MTKEEGLAQIEQAKWKPDIENKGYSLSVNDDKGRKWECFLAIRQDYCDRGHLYLYVDGYLPDRSRNEIDHNDMFPRFFFSIEEATTHLKTFLKWRLWKVRTHPHPNLARDLLVKDKPDLIDY